MDNKPKIYASCKAGCLFETVHKSDFEKSASHIPVVADENSIYWIESGKEYKVFANKDSNNQFTCHFVFAFSENGSEKQYIIAHENNDKYADNIVFRFLEASVNTGATEITIVYEVAGVRYTETISGTALSLLAENDLYISNATRVLLYNYDATITAQGEKGEAGITPHIGANGNWFIGAKDTGVSAQGVSGETMANLSNTQAIALLNPNATLQIEYASGTQYVKVKSASGSANDKISIYNSALGALHFVWSDILATVDTRFISKAPSEADGTEATFIKLGGNQGVWYNVRTNKFIVGSLAAINTAESIVLYYHAYNGSGGTLYEQYADRLNKEARNNMASITDNIEQLKANEVDYNSFIEKTKKVSSSTATIAENEAGITEVAFKRIDTSKAGASHTYYSFAVKPLDTIIVEFYGKSSHPNYDKTNSTGGYISVVFADKDGARIGNQYNASVLGKNRCGYHRYGYVVPLGTAKANFVVTTKGDTVITFHDFNIKVVKDFNFSTRERQGIKYDAHLGLIMSAPENTLPAFELVKKAGFTTCISNCNWTKDDVLVCLHNDEIASRTYEKASGNVQDYTYEELQAFDFGYYTEYYKHFKGTRLPKLEDFVKLMASLGVSPIFRLHTDWYTEKTAKAKDYMSQIYGWICKYGFKGKATVKAFDIRVLNDCYDIMGNNVEYVLDCESMGEAALGRVNEFKTKGIDLTLEFPDTKAYADTDPISEEQLANAVANGVSLSAYTTNNPAIMRDLFLKGVTRFCTDTFSDIVFPID